MREFPRLAVDEIEPPAPLPFPVEDAPRRHHARTDAASEAERALARAQRALEDLGRLVDEIPTTIPFRGPDDDDDNPRAA